MFAWYEQFFVYECYNEHHAHVHSYPYDDNVKIVTCGGGDVPFVYIDGK